MKCGGFSKTEITDEHINIINNKKDEIEKIKYQKEEMVKLNILKFQSFNNK